LIAEGKSYLLWKRSADSVVRCRGESEEYAHFSKWEDQSSRGEQCVFITDALAEYRAKQGLEGPFVYVAEEETFKQDLEGGRIRVRVDGPYFV